MSNKTNNFNYVVHNLPHICTFTCNSSAWCVHNQWCQGTWWQDRTWMVVHKHLHLSGFPCGYYGYMVAWMVDCSPVANVPISSNLHSGCHHLAFIQALHKVPFMIDGLQIKKAPPVFKRGFCILRLFLN